MASTDNTTISVMLAVPDTPTAIEWYEKALGARVLWDVGSVAALEIDGAAFFLHQPVEAKFESPRSLGATTARVEMFVDEPDSIVARAMQSGATGNTVRDYPAPWGKHRQGEFTDPFGHVWLVGDKSPLTGLSQQ